MKFKHTYAPFVSFFAVNVVHTPFMERNECGYDTYHFWNPLKAWRFAIAEVTKIENRHACLYFKWRYAMKSKVVCRVVKDYNGVAGIRTIKEFYEWNYPEQKV